MDIDRDSFSRAYINSRTNHSMIQARAQPPVGHNATAPHFLRFLAPHAAGDESESGLSPIMEGFFSSLLAFSRRNCGHSFSLLCSFSDTHSLQ